MKVLSFCGRLLYNELAVTTDTGINQTVDEMLLKPFRCLYIVIIQEVSQIDT